jgi:hypothetical protein
LLRLLADFGIVNRFRYIILQILCWNARPNRDICGEALRFRPFRFWDADPRENFQLLDVNLIARPVSHERLNMSQPFARIEKFFYIGSKAEC